jgi:hypothetical protein
MVTGRRFSLVQIFSQIYSDWFGKDAQSDYTYSYVWMANQFGHFGLGFILSVFIFWMLLLFSISSEKFYLAVLAQSVLWIIKEIRDYFLELKTAHNSFKPDKGYIIKDLSTDVFFILFGVVVAYVGSVISMAYGLITFAIGLLPSVFLFIFWIPRKMYFQISAIPYYYRLSSFFGKIDNQNVIKINRFVKANAPFLADDLQHIFIFGPYNSGKTSLAIGIGTDFSINLGISRYLSFNKFLDLLNLETEKTYEEGTKIVPWRTAELLIVDNVSVGIDKFSAFNPDFFREFLINSKFYERNLNALQNQKSIWVIGNSSMLNEWVQLFSDLGLNKLGKTATIVLGDNNLSSKLG